MSMIREWTNACSREGKDFVFPPSGVGVILRDGQENIEKETDTLEVAKPAPKGRPAKQRRKNQWSEETEAIALKGLWPHRKGTSKGKDWWNEVHFSRARGSGWTAPRPPLEPPRRKEGAPTRLRERQPAVLAGSRA